MVLAAFGVSGAVVWAGLGAALGSLSAATAITAIAIAYALAYGLAETLRLPVRRFGLRAQVPSPWIRGRRPSVQVGVWGALLGPGLLTHNQYAGIWLVPMMVALSGDVRRGALVGGLAGLAHGLARAVGILRLMPRIGAWERSGAIVLAQLRWRLVDGAALTFVGGILLGRLV